MNMNMKRLKPQMLCSRHTARCGDSPLIVKDLCAQLAPLNRYGFPNLGAAAVDGLIVLIGASRKAVGAALTRSESSNHLTA
jgi:hypothetical protein